MVHSDPITDVRPGDTLVGSVAQPSADNDAFVITSELRRGGAHVNATTLLADMTHVGGWAPQWAELIEESYFVTDCRQLPCGSASPPMAAFAKVALATTDAPGGVASVPWTPFYEVEGVGRDPGAPICGGAAMPAPPGGGNGGVIQYACSSSSGGGGDDGPASGGSA